MEVNIDEKEVIGSPKTPNKDANTIVSDYESDPLGLTRTELRNLNKLTNK